MTEAREFTLALGGRWHRTYGTAPCPLCQPEKRRDQNALSIASGDRGLLLHCKRGGCEFVEILRAAGIDRQRISRASLNAQIDPQRASQRRNVSNAPIARKVWDEATSTKGTVAETYLRGARGVTAAIPESLRFHPHLSLDGSSHPALIARIDGAADFAISRTFLQEDGSQHFDKRMLGPSQGGAVRLLCSPCDVLVVAEGIETTLSLASGLIPQAANYWAALTATNLGNLTLPDRAGHLIVGADGDRAGLAAAKKLADRAMLVGWEVRIMAAPDGQDWNDVLRARARASPSA